MIKCWERKIWFHDWKGVLNNRDRPGIEPKHEPPSFSLFSHVSSSDTGQETLAHTHHCNSFSLQVHSIHPRDGPSRPAACDSHAGLLRGHTSRHCLVYLGAHAGCRRCRRRNSWAIEYSIRKVGNTHHLTIGSDKNNQHHKIPHSADYCSATPR